MLFLLMVFTCLIDEFQFMLISYRHICIRSVVSNNQGTKTKKKVLWTVYIYINILCTDVCSCIHSFILEQVAFVIFTSELSRVYPEIKKIYNLPLWHILWQIVLKSSHGTHFPTFFSQYRTVVFATCPFWHEQEMSSGGQTLPGVLIVGKHRVSRNNVAVYRMYKKYLENAPIFQLTENSVGTTSWLFGKNLRKLSATNINAKTESEPEWQSMKRIIGVTSSTREGVCGGEGVWVCGGVCAWVWGGRGRGEAHERSLAWK